MKASIAEIVAKKAAAKLTVAPAVAPDVAEQVPVFHLTIMPATPEGYTYRINGVRIGPDVLPVMLATIELAIRRKLSW